MKQIETDVAIVSAGTAGLAAAIGAAEKGARVISLEKASTTGGTGNMGMGPLGIESRLQRRKQIALTKEDAFKIFMDYTHWRVDARLVQAYLSKSGSTIDWLEVMGVEFVEPAAYFPGSNFTWHIVKPSSGTPSGGCSANLTKAMTDRARELGVDIHLQTTVKKILKDNGKIVGVIAEDSSGEDVQVNAKAVIVATGGFGDNPDMIKKYTEYEYGRDLFSMRIPGLIGEGLRMAWEVGAARTAMNMELIYNPIEHVEPELSLAFRQPNLLVNLMGERFMNEGIMGNNTFTGNAISIQKNRCAYIIFDEAAKEYYATVGLDQPWGAIGLDKIENVDAAIKKAIDEKSPSLFVADSIEELAEKTGIKKEGLLKTVAEYNQTCVTGRDDIFGKNYRYLKPIQKPRFYAGKLVCCAYGSLGGIKINYRTEVLDKEYETIPGLYAAGTDVCTIYGDSYVFILPGNTMGFALNSGRIAGENAADYAKASA